MTSIIIGLAVMIVPFIVIMGIWVSAAVSTYGEYPLEELIVVQYNGWYEIRKYYGRSHNLVVKAPFKWFIKMTLHLLNHQYNKSQVKKNPDTIDGRGFLNG